MHWDRAIVPIQSRRATILFEETRSGVALQIPEYHAQKRVTHFSAPMRCERKTNQECNDCPQAKRAHPGRLRMRSLCRSIRDSDHDKSRSDSGFAQANGCPVER